VICAINDIVILVEANLATSAFVIKISSASFHG
jgi:hypothetical protein